MKRGQLEITVLILIVLIAAVGLLYASQEPVPRRVAPGKATQVAEDFAHPPQGVASKDIIVAYLKEEYGILLFAQGDIANYDEETEYLETAGSQTSSIENIADLPAGTRMRIDQDGGIIIGKAMFTGEGYVYDVATGTFSNSGQGTINGIPFTNGRLIDFNSEGQIKGIFQTLNGLEFQEPASATYDLRVKKLIVQNAIITLMKANTVVQGENVRFEDQTTPVTRLIAGTVTKVSNTHLVFRKQSVFEHEYVQFKSTRETHYFTDDQNHENPSDQQALVTGSYIQVKHAQGAAAKVLILRPHDSNFDIMLNVDEAGNPLHSIVFINIEDRASRVTIIEGKSIINADHSRITVQGVPKTPVATESGRLITQSLNGQLINVQSMATGVGDVKTLVELGLTDSFTEWKSRRKQVEALITDLGNSDKKIRHSAMETLAGLQERSAADRLLAMAKKESDPSEIYLLEIRLGTIGDPIAADYIRGNLASKDIIIKRGAIQAVGKLGDARAIPTLITIVQDQKSPDRSTAVTALGDLGAKNSVGTLISILENKKENSQLRNEAAVVLTEIQDPQAITPIINALGTFESYFADLSIVKGLDFWGETALWPALAQFFDQVQSDDSAVRTRAFALVEKFGDLMRDYVHSIEQTNNKVIMLAKELEQRYDYDINGKDIIRLDYLVRNPEAQTVFETIPPTQRKLDLKDIAVWLHDGKEIATVSRKSLIQDIAARLEKVGHTMRTAETQNLPYKYTESFVEQQDAPSEAELIKIRIVLTSLEDLGTRNQIQEVIKNELNNNPEWERGGLVILQGGKAVFKEIIATTHMTGKAAYALTDDAIRQSKLELGGFHLHATSPDESAYAGPSGENHGDRLFFGDLAASKLNDVDGFVITPIGNGMFNIDYYTTQGIVIDLGNYQ